MVNMTQPDAVAGSLTEDVADRLRGRLAERRIKQTEVMLATGWSKATAYRKMNGKSAIDVDEFERLWRAFGISPIYLMTGESDNRPWPSPPAGGYAPSQPTGYQDDLAARRRRRAPIPNRHGLKDVG